MIDNVALFALMALGAVLVWRAWQTPPSSSVLLLVLPMLTGCAAANTATRATVDAIGIAVDEATPLLAAEMKKEGLAEIEMSQSRAEAEFRLERVRASWSRVWLGIDIFREAHAAAANLLDQGKELSLGHIAELLKAYCGVRELLATKGKDIPDVPLFPCEVTR